MSFLSDIAKKAGDVINSGKNVLLDQMSNSTTYARDESGKMQETSTTGSQPKIVKTAKDFITGGNYGYTDAELNNVGLKPKVVNGKIVTTGQEAPLKDKLIGTAKAVGEMATGVGGLLVKGGQAIASKTLPGYSDYINSPSSQEFQNKIDSLISEKLKPSNVNQAAYMRTANVLSNLPGGAVGSIAKVGKVAKGVEEVSNVTKTLNEIADLSKNSLKNDMNGVRDKSLEYLRTNPKEIKKGEVRLRELEDGTIHIEDGRHRLQAGTETGVMPKIVDVTSEYTGKPSPKIAAIISKAKKSASEMPPVPVEKYMADNIASREAARGGSTFNQKLKNLVNESQTKLVDFTLPIDKALKQGQKADPAFKTMLENNPTKNIHNQIDRVLRTPNLATAFIKDGGLQDVIQSVDNLDHFDEYLVARHAIDVDTRGINTGRNIKLDQDIIRKFGPQYEEQAKVVTAYSQKLLDYATESGLISKEANAVLKQRYPNYVPLKRIFSELEKDNSFQGGKAVASLGKQSVVQALKGSDREIESPMRSLIERTNQAFQQGEKNKAAEVIASYADVKGNPFRLRKVASTDEVASDMGHISVLRNGKKEIFETTKDIERAAKQLNVEQMNILGQIIATPLRLARVGITGINPSFVMANVARDQLSSFIMADKGLRASALNVPNFLRSMWSAVKHDELYDEWVRAGGGGTAFDMGRNQVAATVDKIRAGRSLPTKALYTVTHPKELLRAVEDIVGRSEEMTRIQQYKAHRDVALAKGLSAEEARAAGAAASRENSTNFARRGEWGTVLNSTFLYLNAGIQGSRLLIRNLKNKPLQTSSKIISSLMFPAATITYWNMADPTRKKAYDDIQDYEKQNNLIIVPPNPVQDESGRWNVIKIPLPPGVGEFANLVRRPIEATYGMDPVKFSEIASTLTRSVSPVDVSNPLNTLTPQALKPSLQAVTNTDLYTGKPIVYPSEAKLPPEQQVRKNTSGTAKAIADTLGVSPIKTEKFIGDTGGGVAKNVLNALDRTFTPDQVGGTSVGASIGQRFNSAAGNATKQDAQNKAYAALDKQDAERAALKTKAENIVEEVSNLPPEEAKSRLKEVAATNKELFKKIMDVKKSEVLGLTPEDKAVVRLGADNGARAMFIHDKYQELKASDPEAAKTYIMDLRKKKILTDDVFLQMTKL